jgi:hypothetical protein
VGDVVTDEKRKGTNVTQLCNERTKTVKRRRKKKTENKTGGRKRNKRKQ